MNRRWMLVSAVILGALVLTSRTPERRAQCVGTLIPAYLPPREIVELVDASPGPQTLIVNPDSGPGARPSAAYRDAIDRAQAAGARVLGYVATTYGTRPASAVEADAQHYREWYAVDGIFLDEVTHDEAGVPYYEALSQALDVPLLVLNPGTVPARGYFDLADQVVTYEGTFADYAARLAREPEWLREIPREQLAHLVYAASREQAVSLFSAPPRSGSLYVTSGVQPNPWGTPPPYLLEEQTAINSTHRRSQKCP